MVTCEETRMKPISLMGHTAKVQALLPGRNPLKMDVFGVKQCDEWRDVEQVGHGNSSITFRTSS
jgi:hypothetical protein